MRKKNFRKKVDHSIMWSFLLYGIFPSIASAQQIDFTGGTYPVLTIDPVKDSGLNKIYVLYNLDNVSLKFRSNNSSEGVRLSTFDSLGAAYSQPITDVIYDGEYLTYNRLKSDIGYIIEDGNISYYIWVIDYSKYPYDIDAISISQDNNCEATVLDISGRADAINYYSINGRRNTISRDIILRYNSLIFDEDTKQFIEKDFQKNIEFINEKITLIPPVLCSTTFELIGDRFLKEWNLLKTIESNFITPIAIMVNTEVIQNNEVDTTYDNSNQITSSNNDLGGSAPAEISFLAYVSDAVIHNEWQFSNDENFEDITYRINQQDLDYVFTSDGTTYVRFIGSNSDGSCESISDTYTVTIGKSELYIPNAFSPNGDGINDEWKVSYQSLIDFKCWIFDRHGHQIFESNNPGIGWDGRYKGRSVGTGVYFYVIQATGADGRKYKRSGDINILDSIGSKSTVDTE